MKTKKSKKILAAFLAVIMVLSCFAAMPFSSFAATYSKDDLKTLLDTYEARVNGMSERGEVYTNLASSYEAWYNAYVVYVCVTAGTLTEANIDTVYKTLQTQMNKMTEWTPYTATATAAADGSYNVDSLTKGDIMSNVLYTYGVGENAEYYTGEKVGASRAGVQYGVAALLYDGINPCAFPVSNFTYRDGLLWDTSYLNSMTINTAPFATPAQYWHGSSSGNSSAGYQSGDYDRVSTTHGDDSNRSGKNDTYRYSTTLYWSGNAETFGDSYLLTYDSQQWIFNTNNGDGSVNHATPIYVVNYAALINAVQSALSNEICDYSYSTAKALLTAVDKALVVNPQSYVTGSDLVTELNNCATAIQNAVNAINTAKSGLVKVNNASYITLANNFNAYTPVAKGNNSDGYYTSESYSPFLAQYNAVKNLLSSINNKGTRFTDATATNESLVNAYKGLVAAEKYIDDSELQAYFEEYYGLHSSYYTAESYAAATEKINAALAYYNNGNYASGITLKDNEEDRAIYETILNDVKTGMEGLRISHEATAQIYGKVRSYNTMLEDVASTDGSQYSNYNTVMDKINECKARMTELDNKAFTTDDEIYSEYVSILTDIANALLELQLAFSAISDGTIVDQIADTTGGYDSDNVHLYLNNAITKVVYFKTTPGTTTYTTEYDLTISNHWQSWSQYRGVQMHGLGLGAYGQDTVSMANGSMKLTWKEGGAAAENMSGSYNYHTALMKAPGGYSAGQDYINIPGNTNDAKILGETTVTVNDLGIASQDFVTPDLYTLYYCDGEERQFVNTDVKQTVTVIDVSDLFEKISEAVAFLDKVDNNAYKCYTTESWTAFSNALAAAQANMDYTTMTVEQIVAEAQIRYNNLDAAMKVLAKNTAEDAHQLVEQPDSSHATCSDPGTPHYICSVCGHEIKTSEEALGHDLSTVPNNDGSTHTIKCSRGDYEQVEACTPDVYGLHCTVCGQALYDPANWDAFNEAKAELEALLAEAAEGSVKYSLKAYETIKISIEALSYYNYTDEQQKTVPLENQSMVDNQTTAIKNAVEVMKNGLADSSVYEANLAKVATLNADAYDVAAVQKAVESFEITQQITVNGKEYTGYKYDEYNLSLGTALSENAIDYTVVVYDFNETAWYLVDDGDGTYSYSESSADATNFHYGDYITAPNPNKTAPNEPCAWATLAQPKSMSDSIYSGLIPKYQLTSKQYTFNVRGDMEIYTTSSATNDENNCKLTFIQALDGVSTGKVLDIQYAENGAKFNLNYSNVTDNLPFYEFSSYTSEDGSQTYSRTVTVTGDMVILVNYAKLSPASYTVTLVDENGDTLETQYPVFNEKVTFSAEGAVAYINNANGKALCYGSEYSFFACQDITVKAVKSIDQEASTDVIASPIIDDNGKVYIVGSFALPEGAKIKSFGIVLNGLDANDSDLSLSDVNSANKIYNLAASKYTCEEQNGNQFTISFNTNTMYRTGTYVAYAIYEDAHGNELYAYSDVVTGATLYK